MAKAHYWGNNKRKWVKSMNAQRKLYKGKENNSFHALWKL